MFAKFLSYLALCLLLIPSAYALELRHFFNVFRGLTQFLQNEYVLFTLLILGTGFIFSIIAYFALSKTPLADNNQVCVLLAVVLGLLVSLPVLFAARNKDAAMFLKELFEGWYGFAVAVIGGFFVFFIVYWIVRELWPEGGSAGSEVERE